MGTGILLPKIIFRPCWNTSLIWETAIPWSMIYASKWFLNDFIRPYANCPNYLSHETNRGKVRQEPFQEDSKLWRQLGIILGLHIDFQAPDCITVVLSPFLNMYCPRLHDLCNLGWFKTLFTNGFHNSIVSKTKQKKLTWANYKRKKKNLKKKK